MGTKQPSHVFPSTIGPENRPPIHKGVVTDFGKNFFEHLHLKPEENFLDALELLWGNCVARLQLKERTASAVILTEAVNTPSKNREKSLQSWFAVNHHHERRESYQSFRIVQS